LSQGSATSERLLIQESQKASGTDEVDDHMDNKSILYSQSPSIDLTRELAGDYSDSNSNSSVKASTGIFVNCDVSSGTKRKQVGVEEV